jgi:hypothetical protein
MNIYFIGSTVFCLAALAIVYWLHSQAQLDLPTPRVAPPVDASPKNLQPPAKNRQGGFRLFLFSLSSYENLPKPTYTVSTLVYIIPALHFPGTDFMAENKLPPRKYPEIYEKIIPVALAVLLVTIVIILTILFAIALGFLPGVNY